MLRRILQTAATIGIFSIATAQNIPHAKVPDALKVPTGEKLILQASATGFQIYTCQAGTDGNLSWTLKAPEADLHDSQGAIIGQHYAGPTWKHNDGSSVTGKVVARAESPDEGAIPWLLLTAIGHSGDGVLSHVTTIQRIYTMGGAAPEGGCDASHRDTETKSRYVADYYFYAPAQ